MSSRIRAAGGVMSLAVFAALAFPAPTFAAKQANDICKDEKLTRMEKDLCIQQVASAQTLDEQKKIQAKFKTRAEERKKHK